MPPMTVNNPFMPQAQAMEPSGCLLMVRIPSGNHMPMKKPTGRISTTAASTRHQVEKTRNIWKILSLYYERPACLINLATDI